MYFVHDFDFFVYEMLYNIRVLSYSLRFNLLNVIVCYNIMMLYVRAYVLQVHANAHSQVEIR